MGADCLVPTDPMCESAQERYEYLKVLCSHGCHSAPQRCNALRIYFSGALHSARRPKRRLLPRNLVTQFAAPAPLDGSHRCRGCSLSGEQYDRTNQREEVAMKALKVIGIIAKVLGRFTLAVFGMWGGIAKTIK